MEELEKNETSTQAEENTVSLASAQALADALAKIEVYTPTTWVDNSSPDIDAEHLNKPEQAIKRVTDALNSAVDVIKDLQSQVTKNSGAISDVNNNLSNYLTKYDTVIASQSFAVGLTTFEVTDKIPVIPDGYDRVVSILYTTQNYLFAQLAFLGNKVFLTVNNCHPSLSISSEIRCVQLYKRKI